MAVTVKPVSGLGTRVMKIREWTPIDKCGAAGNAALQQDTAKLKEVTFTNIGTGPCTIHVAIFNRAAFTGSVISTRLNPSTIALFLQYSTEIPLGATFSLKDIYMDYLYLECEDANAEPVIAVWLESVTGESDNGYLDVIQRR